MRVMVACEFSGVVRDAFIEQGHEAVSVDLLPSEKPGPHIQGDVRHVLRNCAGDIDLLIAHPPCTFLANSGVQWLYSGRDESGELIRNEERWADMEEAAAFFDRMLLAPIPRIAVENPIMHRYADIRKPDQYIQPWQFGHGETKKTGLWLQNLPPLTPTNIVGGREQRVWKLPPGADRWRERSRTFTGIAAAMADQWGNLDG